MDESLIIDTVRFIKAIKERRPLWDSTCPDYVRVDKKRQCWLDVMNLFQIKEFTKSEKNNLGSLLQKKWKNLRGSYTRELTKKGEPGDRKSTYLYFEELSFLRDVVTVKGAENNTPNQTPPEKFTSQKRPAETGESSNQSKMKTDSKTYKTSEILTLLNESIRLREEREYQLEQDSERMFLMSLVSLLKMVPEGKRLDLKIEMMNVVKKFAYPAKSHSVPYLSDVQTAKHTSAIASNIASTSSLTNMFSIKNDPDQYDNSFSHNTLYQSCGVVKKKHDSDSDIYQQHDSDSDDSD